MALLILYHWYFIENFSGVASKYRHNEHIVEYELCHRNIVDKKLIHEMGTFPFESIDLPPRVEPSNTLPSHHDRQSIGSNDGSSGPSSHDFLPSESNLNTAIHHDSDGFSDSGKLCHFKGSSVVPLLIVGPTLNKPHGIFGSF